jgi:hypothetical protein
MPDENVPPLQGRSRIVLTDSGKRVLHVAFAGEHHYSHGPEMASHLRSAVGAERPDGILVDLLQYDYEFGNDVCGVFTAGYHKESRTLVPTCIVATGGTRACMEALYRAGNFKLGPYLGFTANIADGLAWLSGSRNEAAEQVEAAEGQQQSPLRVGSQPRARGNLEANRRRTRLAILGILVALALSFLAPTPMGFAAAAIILLGVCIGVWTIRCPQCGRRLGPITAFRYCTSCGGRIT